MTSYLQTNNFLCLYWVQGPRVNSIGLNSKKLATATTSGITRQVLGAL